MAHYWLSDWLDYHAISSVEDAERAISSPAVVAHLKKAARKALKGSQVADDGDFSILAGRGIDLSGQLDCNSDFCRARQVDQLFGSVWHYFDRIIVQDGLVSEVCFRAARPVEIEKKRLLSHLKMLIYLQSIGAADLVEFRIKPPVCLGHWEFHAREAGFVEIVGHLSEVVDYLLIDGKVTQKKSEKSDEFRFRFNHPLINPPFLGTLRKAQTLEANGDLRRAAATFVAHVHLAHLTSDAGASHMFHAALGTANPVHGLFLRKWRGLQSEDVILNLKLPVLEGLTTWDLISIRRAEGEYFAGFRDALLAAVKERINTGEMRSAGEIAEEIRLDVIQPELNQIQRRLKAAQATLAKKSAVSLVLGTLSTSCGILGGLDPTVAMSAGTTAVLSCAGAASWKYLDDLKDISLSNMFFLWKAIEHAPH